MQLSILFPAEQAKLTPEELYATLCREFDRINAEHFDGKFICPEIVLSKRKSYGGYYQSRRHRIVLSWQAYEEHGWDETINTFRHELAHLVHFNHSRVFWDLAHQLGITHRYAKQPLQPPKTPHKYVYECPVCSRRLYRNRRLRKSSCGRCDKKYNPQFALKLVKNDGRITDN